MNFPHRFTKFLEGPFHRKTDAWAAQFFPEGQRPVASVTVRILVEQSRLGLERMNPSTRFVEDLGMELDLVEFMLALEEAFDFEISDEEATTMETLGTLIVYLHGRIQAHGLPKRTIELSSQMASRQIKRAERLLGPDILSMPRHPQGVG